MREAGATKTPVWLRQECFAQEGVDVLLRYKIRPSHPTARAHSGRARRDRTKNELPDEASHRTAAATGQAVGISPSSAQRVWRDHDPQPRRACTFKLSNDPAFAANLRDVGCLYVDPSADAIVLLGDEGEHVYTIYTIT